MSPASVVPGAVIIAERRNLKCLAERGVVRAFGHAIRLAGTHHDQAVVGRERRIVGVDGIEGEIRGWKHLDNFGAAVFQLAAESFMLRLRSCEVRCMLEAEVLPARDALRMVPTCRARRTHHDALQRARHGVSVEVRA